MHPMVVEYRRVFVNNGADFVATSGVIRTGRFIISVAPLTASDNVRFFPGGDS